MVAVLLRFFKDPRNDEIALQHFFFFLTAALEFFLLHLCCMQFFSANKRLQEIFFKITHPRPSRVKWSAPKVFEVLHVFQRLMYDLLRNRLVACMSYAHRFTLDFCIPNNALQFSSQNLTWVLFSILKGVKEI